MPGRKTALQLYSDSGAPEGSLDYTTIVLIHGYAWHSGTFRSFLLTGDRTKGTCVTTLTRWPRHLRETSPARARAQRSHRPRQQARLPRFRTTNRA